MRKLSVCMVNGRQEYQLRYCVESVDVSYHMASAASPSRKRKSSSTDLDSGSSSRKKSKDAEKDASKSSSQSKRSKSKSKKDIKAGLKTVSELAKLVTSGAVQVPKSLVNYASDKVLLLDQVFTILSPNDVNGMLPDILKGLKIKRIKSLCYEQLKGMSVEEITRALQREDSTATDDIPTSRSEVTSSASNQAQLAATVTKMKDFEKTSEERVSQTTQVLSHKKDGNKTNINPDTENRDIPLDSPQSKDELVLCVSDVSDEDEQSKDPKQAKKTKESEREKRRKNIDGSNNKSALLKEEYIVTSLRVATHKKQSPDDKECAKNERLAGSPNLEMKKETDETESKDDVTGSDDVTIDKDDVMSEMNTCKDLAFDEAELESSDEDSDLNVEVSELDAAKLLEMEMRRRALESELKKFTQNNNQTTKLRSQTSLDDDRSGSEEECNYLELHVSESEMLDSESQSSKDGCKQKNTLLNQDGNRDTGVNEAKVDNDTMDVGQLLEMKLRQKALQSLLNKKKQNSVQ